MLDVMLDLETMGNGPQAAIAAIGAVEFDLDAGELGEQFYTVVDLESSVEAGGLMDASTVLWWMQQSDEARSVFSRPGERIAHALGLFSIWLRSCGDQDEVRVWGNSSAFDNVVLAEAYRRSGFVAPWSWWNNRCYRTVKKLHPEIEMERTGVHHNALDDAVSQARHLILMLHSQNTLKGELNHV